MSMWRELRVTTRDASDKERKGLGGGGRHDVDIQARKTWSECRLVDRGNVATFLVPVKIE